MAQKPEWSPVGGTTWCPNCGGYTLQTTLNRTQQCYKCWYEQKAMELNCRECPIREFCIVEFHTEYGKHPKDCPLLKRAKFPLVQVLNQGTNQDEKVTLS